MIAQIADIACPLRDQIKHQVGSTRYNVWFRNGTRILLEGDTVCVGVANRFMAACIERNFHAIIQRIARETTGRECRVIYRVMPELAAEMRRGPAAPSAPQDVLPPGRSEAIADRPPAGRPSESPVTELRGRFETFVTGPSNLLAYQMAHAIAHGTPSAPNCLFLHGGSGLGKTHLLQSVVNALSGARPKAGASARWMLATGESFTNQYVRAVQERRLEPFRRQYRELDVLVIDDIHYLANKRATQHEFLHTFNAIDTSGKYVVLASDAAPQHIANMSQPLINRFVGSMVVQVDPPDHATRMGILRRRLNTLRASGRFTRGDVPTAVLECIAEQVSTNVRELEGALMRVLALAGMSETAMTAGMARQVIAHGAKRGGSKLNTERIVSVVAGHFGITVDDLAGTSRTKTLSLARSMAMHLVRELLRTSYAETARAVGQKNHVTAMQACKRMTTAIAECAQLQWSSPAGMRSAAAQDLAAELSNRIHTAV